MYVLNLNYMGYQRIPHSRSVYDTEDPDDIEDPRVSDVFNIWATPDDYVTRAGHLTEDVTQADLTKYTDEQLEGRFNYYTRQYTFEQGKKARKAFKQEIQRTKIEIARRKIYHRAEADRVFAL